MKNIFILTATALISVSAQAAISTWTGTTDGDWDIGTNWSGGVPASTDQAIINNGDTVTKTGDLTLDNNSTNDDGLELTNGTLNISGNFTNTIPSYTSNANMTSNLGVSGGATNGTLSVGGIFNLGYKSAGSTRYATFNIFTNSSLTAANFEGKIRAFGTDSQNGGWKLNVLGGSLDVTNTFDFSDNAISGNGTGLLTIGTLGTATGGNVTIGTMSDDWDDLAKNVVLFNDNLGSLTFGKTNWALEADVLGLITDGHIQKDASVTEAFSITDNGTTWTVTVIPEPSTFMLLGIAMVGLLAFRRR